jgi:long-chain acyl-CoA synthetase
MNTISDFLINSANNFPKKTAIITKENKCTYEELHQFANNVSSALLKYPQKSVISLVFENSIHAIATYLGILQSGCIVHIISPNTSIHNISDQLNSSNPHLIIGAKTIIDKINVSIPTTNFDTILSNNIVIDKREIYPTDIAYLVYTSGTTSKPKGVAVSHANATFTTSNIVKVLDYTKSDIDVLPLPLSHSFGLGCLHTSLYVGSTLVLHKNTLNPQEIFESVDVYGATTFAAVPATLTKLLHEFPDDLQRYFSNLRLVITNSTFIPKDTVIGFRNVLKKGNLATYYGLTEASRSTFMIFNSDGKTESVGLPAPDVTIKLVDENVHNTKYGEIWIKGSNVIRKYWNNSEADKNLKDGWLRTGDLGYFDDDGYLYLKGRIDDTINVAGEKVTPQEVERIVKLLTEVEEAVVIGTEHNVFGQVVKLFVKKTNNSSLTKSEIMSHCIKNLERYKVPTVIEFVTEFPRTEYGKIKRFMLK